MKKQKTTAITQKSYLLKIFLLIFVFEIIAGCTSTPMEPGVKHWHGKNLHKIEKVNVSPIPAGTRRHWHGKNLHKIEAVGR